MPRSNQTLEFFSKNPKYVEIIDIALNGESKTISVVKGRLEGETFKILSEELGNTREYIRQLEMKGLRKIKHFISRTSYYENQTNVK